MPVTIGEKVDEFVDLAVKDCCKVSFPPTTEEVIRRAKEYIKDFNEGRDYDYLVMSEEVLYRMVDMRYSPPETWTPMELAHHNFHQLMNNILGAAVDRAMKDVTEQASDWQDVSEILESMGFDPCVWNDYTTLMGYANTLNPVWSEHKSGILWYVETYGADEKPVQLAIAFVDLQDRFTEIMEKPPEKLQNNGMQVKFAITDTKQYLKQLAYYLDLLEPLPF